MKVGIDICKNDRFENNSKLAVKFLHPDELAYFKTLPLNNQALFLASRWALKEAIYKCDNTIKMIEVNLTYLPSGEIISNLPHIIISLSHEKEYTVAVAINTK